MISEGGADETDAEGQATAAKTGGQRDGRKVQQVDEIRVEAEIGVAREGLGGNLVECVDRAGGRHDEHIRFLPQRLGFTAQLRETIERLERVAGAVLARRGDDLACDWQQRLGGAAQERLDDDEALSQPWAAVKKRRSRAKWREIDLDARAADLLERAARAGERGGRCAVAKEFPITRP